MKRFAMMTLSIVLSCLMVIYMIPTQVYAYGAEALREALSSEETEAPAEEPAISAIDTDPDADVRMEVSELRTATGKTFLMDDGSYRVVEYGSAVHYSDGDAWQDIDNTLSENTDSEGSGFVAENAARVKFANNTASSKLLSIKNGNYQISFGLVGGNKTRAGVVTNPETPEYDESVTKYEQLSTLTKLVSKVTYPEVFDNTTLEYVLVGDKIKENFVLSGRSDDGYTYTFEMKLNKLTAALQADGSILLSDEETAEAVYILPAPFMYDAAGNHSPGVSYALEADNSGKYTITLTADAEWINADERVFPVTIDPTIGTPETSTLVSATTYVTGADAFSPNTHIAAGYYSAEGFDYGTVTSHLQFTIPELPNNTVITQAWLVLDKPSDTTHTNINIAVHQLTQTVSETYMQNNLSSGEVIDYFAMARGYVGRAAWNITESVKAWSENSSANFGLALYSLDGTDGGIARFYSIGSTENRHPYLEISYRSVVGLEDYYTYTSQSIGLAGSFYINDFTGNLVGEIPVGTSTDAIMPYTPTLYYNSNMSDTAFTHTTPAGTTSAAITAKGWRWNFQQTITPTTIDGKQHYIWTDGDGTQHWFSVPETSDGSPYCYGSDGGLILQYPNGLSELPSDAYVLSYYDCDGLNLQLVIDESGYYIIENKGISEVDTTAGSVIHFTSDGLLDFVRDQNGNVRYFRYTDGKVTSISLKPYGGTEFTQFNIAYHSSGLVNSVTNVYTRIVSYCLYADSVSGTAGTTGTVYLREVQFVAPCTCNSTPCSCKVLTARATYAYSASSLKLTQIFNEVAQQGLTYSYASSGAVSGVTETAKVDSFSYTGQGISVTYEPNRTVYRTAGKDDVLYNADDLYTVILFDHEGRTVSSYTTDSTLSPSTVYGANSAEYMVSENVAQQNRITGKNVIGSPAVNRLRNPSFELNSEDSASSFGWLTTGGANATPQYTNARTGYGSVSVTSSFPIYQTMYLIAETAYTFSVYVKAPTPNVSAQIYVSTTTSADEAVATSKTLDYATTGSAADGYVRLHVTFTPENSDTYYLFLKNASASPVYFDDAMLEMSSAPSQFSLYGDGNIFVLDQLIFAPDSSAELSTGEIVLEGKHGKEVWAKKQIELNAYDETATSAEGKTVNFVLSGWGKANSGYNYYDLGEGMGYYRTTFALVAKVYFQVFGRDASGAVTTQKSDFPQEYVAFFDPDIEEWQFASVAIQTTEAQGIPLYIEVFCRYDYNVNTAHFDNISLVEDSASYTAYTYNGFGQVVSERNASGNSSTSYGYDGAELSSASTQNDEHLAVTYYDNGNVQSVIESVGNGDDGYLVNTKTDYEYNSLGLVTETTTIANNDQTEAFHKAYTYSTAVSSYGQPLSESNSYGSMRTVYNGNGLPITDVGPDDVGLRYTYDNFGNILSVSMWDYGGGSTAWTSNAPEVQYVYNEKQQTTYIRTKSTAYYFAYNQYGNLQNIMIQNGDTLVTYGYNANNGKLTRIFYGNGKRVDYTYDALDRVSKIWYNFNETQSFEYLYNNDGNLAAVIDNINGRKTEYEYNASGQNVATYQYVLGTDGYVHTSSRAVEYDTLGRACKMIYSFSIESSASSITYVPVYEGDTNVIKSWKVEGIDLQHQLDAFGRPKQVILKHSEGSSENTVLTYDYSYVKNATDRVTSDVQVVYEASMRVQTFESVQYIGETQKRKTEYIYTYNAIGNITQIVKKTYTSTLKNSVWSDWLQLSTYTTTYTYDKIGQLIRENNQEAGVTIVCTYDAAGNVLTKIAYEYTTGTPLSIVSTLNMSYNGVGWGDLMTPGSSTVATYDEIGNLESVVFSGSSDGQYYTWDRGRNLMQYRMSYGTTHNYRLEYRYNDEGIRIEKIYWDNLDRAKSTKREYDVDGSTIIRETLYTYSTTASGWVYDRTFCFLYDRNGLPIGMRVSDAAGEESTYYYRKNLQGDVVAVLTEDGYEIRTYVYDAWGRIRATDFVGISANVTAEDLENARLNPIRYRGYYYDAENETYYLQSRYYNATWGRFLNADEHINANGDLLGFNMFAYCGNNPVMYSDPTGESITAILVGVLIGVVIGAVAGGVSAAITEGDIVSGIVSGAVSGLISTVGTAFSIVTGGVGGILIAGAAGLIAGISSSAIQQGMTVGWDSVDWFSATRSGLISATFNAIGAGFTGAAMSRAGTIFQPVFDKGIPYMSRVGEALAISFPAAILTGVYTIPSTLANTFTEWGLYEINHPTELCN